MSKSNLSKTNIILLGVIIVLAVTFGLSFKGRASGKDKREVVKTSLVNPKYKDEIIRFELRRNEEFVVLKRENNVWFCSEDNINFIPAENKKVDSLIEELIKVQNLSKISYKKDDLSSFGFNYEDQFTIRYYISPSLDNFFDLNFGNHDFSLSNRYVMSGKNIDLYEVDSSFERYLYTALNQWSDPYIISRNLNGEYKLSDVQRVIRRVPTKDGITTQTITQSKVNFEEWQKPSPEITDFNDYVSKLLELRHGGAAQVPVQLGSVIAFEAQSFDSELPNQIGDTQSRFVADLELTLEMGDTSEFNLRFFPNDITGKITVICQYDFPQNSSRQIVYSVEISGWTYDRIFNHN